MPCLPTAIRDLRRFVHPHKELTLWQVDPQRFNLYGYARNNPLKWIDPNGEKVKVAPGSSMNEIYELVGGQAIFDQYFQVVDGQVTVRDGVDLSSANAGVRFLTQLISSPDTFLIYLGADPNAVARMFAGTVGKDGKLNSEGQRIANMFKRDAYIVGTATRPRSDQPAGDVFTVLAVDPARFSRTQIGDGGVPEFAAGVGQRVTAIGLMMHELAENLNFSMQGTHNGPMPNRKAFKGKAGRKAYDAASDMATGGWAYRRAHGFAQQYEIDLRRDLKNVSGGFAGGALAR